MSEHETPETDLRDSTPNANGPDGAAGDMGVSSERVGPAGPGQVSTDGLRDTSPLEGRPADDADVPARAGPRPPGGEPRGAHPQGGLLVARTPARTERRSPGTDGSGPATRGAGRTAATLRAVEHGRSKTCP